MPVEGVDRVNESTTHLLMEGARLIDEGGEPSPRATIATIPPVTRQATGDGTIPGDATMPGGPPSDEGWD